MLSFLSNIVCGIVSCAFFLFLLSFLTFYIESFTLWSVFFLALLWFYSFSTPIILSALAILFLFSIPKFRKLLITGFAMKALKALKLMPQISETEKIALEAGSTWIEAELFSGAPNFKNIMEEPYPKPSGKELAFLNNQCDTVCRMMNDDKAYEDGDLPAEIWEYMKKEKFLGLIIPEEYEGLGFSALGHSQVINKLGSYSIPLAISTMVPNSLGPAELLIHYGTKSQKDYYLPRLARGEEIPCFGLTEPHAGSDAGSITSSGVIFKGEDGKLYIKLNWKKRWITLGAAATLLGLAVKLRDPENLLGKGKNIGITCVLVPSTTPGVLLGRRHNPLGVPFINSPIDGKDVVVSIDQIIGGTEGAGKGWQMLMECLAAGRSISLPSQAAGGSKAVNRLVGTYAQVRHQFGMPIGKFEGVGEAIARIATTSYLMESARIFTAAAVDGGIKPAVASAIIKYHATEFSRKLVNDAMDVLGGVAISEGPRNTLARKYIALPIAITVEGANILTRTMIIFGQGAIRCHPYAYKEVLALEKNDLDLFDEAFSGHVAHIFKNMSRSLVLSLSRGYLARTPKHSPFKNYYRKLSWASASFAFAADFAMGTLGGKLKFKEKLAGRYADILSWMYLITCALRRFEAEGSRKEDEPYIHYIAQNGLCQIQTAFEGIYTNLDVPVLGKLIRWFVAPWAKLNAFSNTPSDTLSTTVADLSMKLGEQRERMSECIYYPLDDNSSTALYEEAFVTLYKSKSASKKIARAIRKGEMPKDKSSSRIKIALEKGIISQDEASLLEKAEFLVNKAIQVDDFKVEDFGCGKLNVHA
jgi:acyl-CoA dehydrogenase